jgi:hypothetical protein
MTESLEVTRTAIMEKRHRGVQPYLELYCHGEDCPVRTITLSLKDDANTLASFLDRPLRCPICQSADVALEWVRTMDEREDEWDRDARSSVNMQLWARDHRHEPFLSYPASVVGDERLPPTPPGWWEKNDGTHRTG